MSSAPSAPCRGRLASLADHAGQVAPVAAAQAVSAQIPQWVKAMAAILAMDFIFMFFVLLNYSPETGMRTTSSLG